MSGTWWVGESDLDEYQKDVISFDLDGNYLVVGPPGSGKTNILLLRANFISMSGNPNIAIVVFTKTLRKYIASGGREYAFPVEKIMTCNKWQRDILYEYGVEIDPPVDFQSQRKYLSDKLKELVQSRKLSNIFDAILLDEAQDYNSDEIELFSKLTSRLFAVADSRQQIYMGSDKGMDPLAHVRAVVQDEKILRYHYRNGLEICKLADGIAKDTAEYQLLASTSQYNEKMNPSKVSIVRGNIGLQVEEIVKSLRNQLRAYPGELLAVVCPKRDHVNQVWRKLLEYPDIASKISLIDDDDEAFDSSKPICVCTVHSAKGLEVRALHFAAAEHIKFLPQQRNIGFTAVTRAKTSLTIYHEGDLKGWFQSAVAGFQQRQSPPTLGELFKGNR